MSRIREFKLPDLGEGLTEGEILKWLVQPGDVVKINDPIVEVETAKAAVEVPSPYAGVVTTLFHPEGSTVDVGTPIIAFDTQPELGALPETEGDADIAGSGSAPAAAAREAVNAEFAGTVDPAVGDGEVEAGKIGGAAPGGRTAVLVGYGPKSVTAERRKRKDASGPGRPAPMTANVTVPARVSAATVAEHAAETATKPATGRAKATPPVRKLAKDLGVDLVSLVGSGPQGSVTRSDVQAAAEGGTGAALGAVASAPRRAAGERTEERIPIKGVLKLMAANMVQSAFTAPHVTEFITVDVTPMMALRDSVAALPDFADVKVSPLLLVAKALLNAVRRNPRINSTWDDAAGEVVVKHYVNLGIAAATPRGLLVPNVKDADLLSLGELAAALQALTAIAREGHTQPTDMAGGTITITNVGVFGVDSGTPILNAGEAAILCFGAVREQPWVHEGAVAIRQVTQLSLSFDHRIVDGQLGSQFLSDIARQLADPAALLAWS